MKKGRSADQVSGGEVHLIADGARGVEVRDVGFKSDCVCDNTETGRFGGMMKCRASSLNERGINGLTTKGRGDTHVVATK